MFCARNGFVWRPRAKKQPSQAGLGMVMERDDGEAHASAGQDCPAQKPIGATNEITIKGERLRIVQATDEEGAAITQYLKERAESAPAGARIGRASALARSGLRFAAVVLLATGVGVGLGDGNVFDDVGCSVASSLAGFLTARIRVRRRITGTAQTRMVD